MRNAHVILRKTKKDNYVVVKIRKPIGLGFDFIQVGHTIDEVIFELLKIRVNRLVTIDVDGKIIHNNW